MTTEGTAAIGLQFSGLGDLAAWATLAFTVVTALLAGIGFGLVRLRDRRQALADLHVSLTSGETAQARNVIGALLYGSAEAATPTRLEAIEAYFMLIWAVQRARNVFRIFRIRWHALNESQGRLSSLMHTGRSDASLALTWNLIEIADNIMQFHDKYGEKWGVDDADAWADIGSYLVEGGLKPTASGV
ncbi:hypothetical protein [Microbacterium sp. GXF6406]